MRKGAVVAAVLLSPLVGFAFDLSGSWSGSISLGESFVPLNTITVDLGFADWELTVTSTLKGASLVRQELSLSGSLGALGIAAGAAFRIPEGAGLSRMGLMSFSVDGVEFLGGYVSFTLDLGNLSLKLTLVGEAPSPGERAP